MAVKVFTVKEANRILPVVEQAVVEIRSKALEIIRLQDRIGVLVLIGGGEPASPEHTEFEEHRQNSHRLIVRVQRTARGAAKDWLRPEGPERRARRFLRSQEEPPRLPLLETRREADRVLARDRIGIHGTPADP